MRHVSTPEVHAFFSGSGSLAIRALAGCTPGAASLACTTKSPAHRSKPAAFVRLIHN